MEFLNISGNHIVIASAVVLGLLGMLALRMARARNRVQSEFESLKTSLARAEAQAKEQSRVMARMRSEKGTVASLALSLPHVVQALNRGDLDPRRVPGLILNLAESIFQPGQVLYYAVRGPEGGRPQLSLIRHHGLGSIPAPLRQVPFGQGKIGWVAEHKIDMLREDWLNPARFDGERVDDNHPTLKPDIIGPLVHHTLEGPQLLGVLSLGSLGTRPRDEKLMFQLVTNLGSLALVNAQNVMRLREQANTDGLTSLLNKRYFMDSVLPRLIVNAEREARELGLFIFDIDHFKNFNDTHGHPAGDELLQALAALLRPSLRPGDVCCRFGGEEFIVAMPETGDDEALRAADRIRRTIEEYPFPHEHTQPNGKVTISGGVAMFPRDGTSAHELTSHADIALYESKRGGRNRVERYRGVDIGDAEDVTGFDLVAAADEDS